MEFSWLVAKYAGCVSPYDEEVYYTASRSEVRDALVEIIAKDFKIYDNPDYEHYEEYEIKMKNFLKNDAVYNALVDNYKKELYDYFYDVVVNDNGY